VSLLRRLGGKRRELAKNVAGLRPEWLAGRLNAARFAAKLQARLLVNQVLKHAREMGLDRPMVIYTHGSWILDLAREFKARNYFLVHVCLDNEIPGRNEALAEPADLALVIPKTVCHRLRARFGEKVQWIPQLGPDLNGEGAPQPSARVMEALARVPRPRLGYLGRLAEGYVHKGLLAEVLRLHPEWHFIACGPVEGLGLPNLTALEWLSAEEVPGMVSLLDVGFMPYNCSDQHVLHGVPLKLFDYFAAGVPVVSTPLIHLREYAELVYLGDSADELAEGIRRALAEPADDPRRERRRRIAGAHSIEEFSRFLPAILNRGLAQSKSAG